MSLYDYIKNDPRQEIAFLLVVVISTVMRWADKLGDWPWVVTMCLALVTLLGAQTYAGIKAGPEGFEVKRDD